MADISVRRYIRWFPDPASEPTSTIVLTSPGRHYVDVRLLLPTPASPQASLPLDRLDWAIAGTSSSTPPTDDGHGGTVSHARWHHWIDSRTPDAEAASDEGDNYSQPDGTTLEKGRMVNPATGQATDYEELWDSPAIRPAGSGPGRDDNLGALAARCVVLQLHDDAREVRGAVVLLGQYCQGLMRYGEDIAVERWQWNDETHSWEMLFKVGQGDLACKPLLQHAHELERDMDVVWETQAWKVVECVQRVSESQGSSS